MDRRTFLRLSGGAAALSLGTTRLGGGLVGAAEAATLPDLGLPELKVTLTDAGYRLSPATTTAGWTLVTFENQQSQGDNSADIMLLPAGETAESIHAAVAAPGATPPAWLYTTAFAGAPWTPAGTTAQAVVRLTAGDWIVLDGPIPLPPASLTVTEGDGAAKPPALTADVEVTLQEFAFLGLEKPVPAGRQLWKVTNAGKQPHLMVLNGLPRGTTPAQFMGSMAAMMTGTPAADAIDPGSMPNAGGCSTLSAGQSLFLALDLAAGTYGATCFFPDEQTGAPHMAMGMVQVFTAG